MNILFLTIGGFESIYTHDMYPDIFRYFMEQGHDVYIVSSREKRHNKCIELIKEGRANLLKVRIGNITKSGIIEKGLATVCVEHQYKRAIKKYFAEVKFDLVIYSTPPVTLESVVRYVKKRDGALTYLLLKDIFPQNAVDLGMLKKEGLQSFIYRYFRVKEKTLYKLSDCIGCMSEGNKQYVLRHNSFLNEEKVEVCPNCIEPIDMSTSAEERIALRTKYNIPINKKIFVYGGNLGKPQGIDFLIECLKSYHGNGAYFLIVGDGTEFSKLNNYVESASPSHIRLLKRLPKDEYDKMIGSCDVGMIFLNHNFTIPNFPSRMLAYMQAKLPILALTDSSTDIGKVIVDGNFGWWAESNDISRFNEMVNLIVNSDNTSLGENGYNYLLDNYIPKVTYERILPKLGANNG